jgi:hypothetical protein
VLAFADAEIIRMATEDFIPVAADDWYQRRRKDAEGDFFRGVADALGRTGPGGRTRQGIYLFAADGTPLGYKNHQDPDVMRGVLRDGLRKFARLPAAKRKPGAVVVPDRGKVDPNYSRTPPPGGLTVKVYTRILDLKGGEYARGTCPTLGGDKAARDHLWITAAEVEQLAPANAEVGFRYDVPAQVAERIARFHLVDNTRGEPPAWPREEVRANRMGLRVVAATADAVELKLDGEVGLASAADPAEADRGFVARLAGDLRYAPAEGTFDRFDVVAVGWHWGDGPFTRESRPGKSLLGLVFALTADRIPPQGIRYEKGYYGRE